MMDHLWAPSGDPKCPQVYVPLPRRALLALVYDDEALGGVRVRAVTEEADAENALAIILNAGAHAVAITRGRLNGRPVPGGIAELHHQDALKVARPRSGAEGDSEDLTLFFGADGLLDTFEYEPPEDAAVPQICAACGLQLQPGESVRRACPRPDCGALIHAECASTNCPLCSQEFTDATGEKSIWIPDAPQRCE